MKKKIRKAAITALPEITYLKTVVIRPVEPMVKNYDEKVWYRINPNKVRKGRSGEIPRNR